MNEARNHTRQIREIAEGYVTIKKGTVALAEFHRHWAGYTDDRSDCKIIILPRSRRLKLETLAIFESGIWTRSWQNCPYDGDLEALLAQSFSCTWLAKNPNYSHLKVSYHVRMEDVYIHPPIV